MAKSTPTDDGEQEDRDGRGARVVAGLHPAEDVDGRGLGLERDVPGQQDQRAELADRPGEGERAAGEDRRASGSGRRMLRKIRRFEAPSEAAASSISWSSSISTGCTARIDERQRHEQQRHDDRGRGVGDVDRRSGCSAP